MQSLYDQVESRYSFKIPTKYREMEQRGWLTGDFIQSWDVEWMPLEAIRDYEFKNYQKPGLAPFAHNCASDLWCWWPEAANEQRTPIVLCPHDYMMAEVWAPHFQGFLYRQILNYVCGGFSPEEESQAREHLRLWSSTIGSFFPASWQTTIASFIDRPLIITQSQFSGANYCTMITRQEYDLLVQRDLKCERIGEEFAWMKN